ncbi:hypothetical protein BF32_4070 [Bacillus thuringiensis]|uniref:hypothetical protein n=1 Tax=Bacillus thuringiensis TaxID=1428 RepID=UPI0003077439|nr:hypothetical protein [Bacillus thuringiensis]AJH70958.1 hypothetical protein BF32_4070 [Bacillus thuringiensis]QKH29869.1 hypothetical protein FOC87_09400 [Bacillus thuringiensis]QKQ41004.1 hypothetical protein FOC85_17625 [Bacillus thuringiensis]HDR8036238.1 hypothetical protein [Bacillus cereus]
MGNDQIKSKNRVVDYGEVLTPSWMVNDMLDLIPATATKISSRYLENSAGEGAFLVEILNRKLELIFSTYHKLDDLEFYTVVALTNIYGIELLMDNIEVCKLRLRTLIMDYFVNQYRLKTSSQFFEVIDHILNINIINMNALSYKIPMINNHKLARDINGEIIYSDMGRISEWKIDYCSRELQRIEYLYCDVVREQQERCSYEQNLSRVEPLQLNLFDSGDEMDLFDEEHYITIATPIRIFSIESFVSLNNAIVLKDGE